MLATPIKPAESRSIATIIDALQSHAESQPGRVAYRFLSSGDAPPITLTFSQLDQKVRHVAADLARVAIPGERALLLHPSGLDFIVAFLGCLAAGVVAVPLFTPHERKRTHARVESVISDAKPSVVLAAGPVAEAVQSSISTGANQTITWINTTTVPETPAKTLPSLKGDDIAFLQYTSGSTSNPKGVAVTHTNIVRNEAMIQEVFGTQPDSVIVGWLPLFHDMGLIGNVLQPLYVGATSVLMHPLAFLQNPLSWLQAISKYRATISGGPNFGYELCIRKISSEARKGLDLSSWKVAFNGAEPVRADTMQRFAAAFAESGFQRSAFQPCYGLAEATLLVSGARGKPQQLELNVDPEALLRNQIVLSHDKKARTLVACGGPPSGLDVRIVSPETREECAKDEIGEIWVKGPSVAKGYWNRNEESAETFQGYLGGNGEGPFLRTGDFGFIKKNQIFVTGRIKDLLIIRGQNHYPQDIELTVERSHPMMQAGAGAAFSVEVSGEEQLVVVQEVTSGTPEELEQAVQTISSNLAQQHQLAAHAIVLIRKGAILKTSSNKIQRQACKRAFLNHELQVVKDWRQDSPARNRRPRTKPKKDPTLKARQAAIAWLIAEISRRRGAKLTKAVLHSPITAFGMDSLAAIELSQEIQSRFRLEVSMSDLFEDVSISELVNNANPGHPQDRDRSRAASGIQHLLSHGQRALWLIQQMAPDSAAYNIARAVRVKSALNVDALRRSFQSLVDLHPSLRTTFPTVDGQPVQQIQSAAFVYFEQVDAKSWTQDQLEKALLRESQRTFDLATGPLFRVHLYSQSPRNHLLHICVHHIIVDFWSLALLVEQMGSLYQAYSKNQEPKISLPQCSYADFVTWQEEQLSHGEEERLWNYWEQELNQELEPLHLPLDQPRPPIQTFRGSTRAFTLGPALSKKLRALGAAQQATVFMAALAAFQVLLHRLTGQKQIVTGSPSAGRSRAEFADTVGYFVNPLPLRADFSREQSFNEVLAQVRSRVLGAFAHDVYPFPLMTEKLGKSRDVSSSPVFQTMFVFQRSLDEDSSAATRLALSRPGTTVKLGGLSLEPFPLEEQSSLFDLMLNLGEGTEGLSGTWQYNSDLFEPATIQRWSECFKVLLQAAVQDPDCAISRLPLLPESERKKLVEDFNQTEVKYARQCLHQAIEQQAKRWPTRIAVAHGETQLQYAELDRRANQIGRYLSSFGVRPGDVVGICMPRSADMVAVMLGVWKAGAAYVPLDAQYPTERLQFMLQDSAAKVVVTEHRLRQKLGGLRTATLYLDEEREQILQERSDPISAPVEPGQLAYVIYTSGSTGTPKGVMLTHANAISFVTWVGQAFSAEELSGVLATTSICFDLSIFELWATLGNGGTMVLADDVLDWWESLRKGTNSIPARLINTVPSAIARLLQEGPLPSSVMAVNLAGEALKESLVTQVYEAGNIKRLNNLYGPTETTTYSTWTTTSPEKRVMIGRGTGNTQLYVLDRDLELAPIGVVGELYIAGDGLAYGYWKRPALTADRFLPNPYSKKRGNRMYRTGDLVRWHEDGQLEYMGRSDQQVKVRGFRIELGEIEAALSQCQLVRENAVIIKDGPGGKHLVAYVEPHAGKSISESLLRAHLQTQLPSYMLPSQFVLLESLPRTPNGKIDRKALPEPQRLEKPLQAPRNQVEAMIADIFAQVLGQEAGVEESFFEIGGHSLSATQVMSRIQQAFQVELPLRTLFECPTVAGLAQLIEGATRSAAPTFERVSRTEPLPLSFAQESVWLHNRVESNSSLYNIAVALRLKGRLDLPALRSSLEEIVHRHEILRTTFPERNGIVVQQIAATVEISVSVVETTETGLPDLLEKQAQAPFNLRSGPLVRFLVVRLGDLDHILVSVLHHIVCDGWSLGVMIRELSALYGSFSRGSAPSLPPLPFQYADFAVWQRKWLQGEFMSQQMDHWKQRLAGLRALELPTDWPRTSNSVAGAKETAWLPEAFVTRLSTFSREQGVTLFMTLLTAFKILLYRYTGQDDLSVGTPIANRNRAETEPLIGCFVNPLVLRCSFSPTDSVADLLRKVRKISLEAYAHQDLPFEKLVAELAPIRDPGISPLFQVAFVMQNAPLPVEAWGETMVEPMVLDTATSKFDLDLILREVGGSLEVTLDYRKEIFAQESMKRLIFHYQSLLEGMIAGSQAPVSLVEILSKAEREQLLLEGKHVPQEQIHNRYVFERFELSSISVPAPAATIYVLDQQLNLTPRGIKGELYIGGSASQGYLHRPELTAERFVPDPFSSVPGARMYATGERARWHNDGTLVFFVDQIPLTTSKEVDLTALPKPAEEEAMQPDRPMTSTEELIAAAWSGALGVKNVGVQDNFFELGGHSLLVTRIFAQLERFVGFEIPIRSIFEFPVLQDLAAHLDSLVSQSQPSRIKAILPQARSQELPLSSQQERLWFLDRYSSSGIAYNLPGAVRLRGNLNRDALRRALRQIVQRHEVLRTSFVQVGARSRLYIHAEINFDVPEHDLRESNDNPSLEERLQQEMAEEAVRPFVLREPGLFRARLLRTGDEDYVLLLTLHHIVFDGWSIGVMVRELTQLYSAYDQGKPSPLTELDIQYADYAVWQRELLSSGELTQGLEYWKAQLRDLPLFELPPDHPRPAVQTFNGTTEQWMPSRELAPALKALAQEHGVTVYMVLVAALKILLARYTGKEDIVVGTPVANRMQPVLETLIGFFVNTVVLRVQLNGNPAVSEALARTSEVCLSAYAHQSVPFESLVDELEPQRDLSHNPLFQIALVLQNASAEKLQLPGLEITTLPSAASGSKFDFSWVIEEDENGLRGFIEYNTDLYEKATAQQWVRHYERVLWGMVGDSRQPISSLALLSEPEKQLLLSGYNQTTAQFPQIPIHELFEQQVARIPDAQALEFQGQSLNYADLNQRANQLAHYLSKRGIAPEARVGILVSRGPELVVALLGVLKAGAGCVPIDSNESPQRLEEMIKAAQPHVLLTQDSLLSRLPDCTSIIVNLDQERHALSQEPPTNPARFVSPENAAFIVIPGNCTAAVCICHRSLASLMHWAKSAFSAEDLDGALVSTWFSSEVAILEVFAPLTLGGCVILAQNAFEAAAKQAGRVKMITTTPSTIGDLLRRNLLPESLRTINLAGEPVPAELIRRILNKTKVERIFRLYNTAESGVCAAYLPLSGKSNFEALPMGKPIENIHAYVLDQEMEPAPAGLIGQLYFGGAGIARGYLDQPALTAAAFIPNPFGETDGERLFCTGELARRLVDGNLELLGRPPDQVTVRRRRIALHAVESALLKENEVADAVVNAEGAAPDTKLVAYVVPRNSPSYPTPEWEQQWRETLRMALKRQLPESMVPSEWRLIEMLPLRADGKLDRDALAALEPHSELVEEIILPVTDTEQTIANIWKQVLKIDEVGMDQTFFEVGGKSLLIPEVHLALESALGKTIEIVDLFQYPTIRSLAEYLDVQPIKETPLTHETSIARATFSSQAAAEIKEPAAELPEINDAQIVDAKGFAIIGMTGRFPGARNVEEFWQNLLAGRESIIDVSEEELRLAGIDEAVFSSPSYVKRAAIVDDADLFDAKFFNMSAREAEMIDPQQRIFLECAWEVLEKAGYSPGGYKGKIGIYAGSGAATYMLNLMADHRTLGTSDATPIFFANVNDFLSTRTSYKLNLSGPSVTVQTACSTSLVAVHIACRALMNNECDIALAGGITVRTPQKMGDNYVEGGIVSPDGHCRAFDEKADGAVRANGAGLVAIKRLEDAIRDRDHIHAIIRGTAINNDGARKMSYTAPSVEGQREVIRMALAEAGVKPELISYVEAHGTGTSLGDPIEVAALTQAFRLGTENKGFCGLGSVKSNVGHLDSAAGIAGLIKTVLALENKVIPPSINFERPNPKIDFVNSPFYVNAKLTEWKNGDGPRRAGVSSFGIGGTNAHAVLEEAPPLKSGLQTRPYQMLLLSAKTSIALEATTVNLASYLESQPGVNIADVAYTLQVGREEFAHRRVIVCRNGADALDALNTLDLKRVITGFNEPQKRPVVFMFPGQGAQYANMALGLYENEKTFRQEVDACATLLKPNLGFDIRDVIYPKGDKPQSDRSAERLMETEVTQPALFVIEYALAKLWMKWGVQPHAMIGHSIGEYVAACLAGVFSLEEALSLVSLRGKLMQGLPRGSMLVVPLPEKEVLPLLNNNISLAAVNSADYCVVSGPEEELNKLDRSLTARDLACRKLQTSHAFHSAMMDPILDRFAIACSMIRFQPPKLRYISNLTGTWITAAQATSPDYWATHLRGTVRFADGVRELVKDSDWVLLEVGPGRSLSTLARWNPHRAKGQVVLNCVRHPEELAHDEAFLLACAGRLWMTGVKLGWDSFYENERRRRVVLPTYPFDRQRYWIDPPKRDAVSPALSRPTKNSNIADWFYLPSWKSTPSFVEAPEWPDSGPWLIFADQHGFATSLKEQLRRQGMEVWTVTPGLQYLQVGDSVSVRPQEADDYRLLFQRLKEAAKLPTKIVYLWTLAASRALWANERDLDSGFFAPLYIAQALGALGNTPNVEILLVSNYLYDVTRDGIVHPQRATLMGPCRVIPQEYAQISCRNIDLDCSLDRTPAPEMLSCLLEEATLGSTDSVVAYRNGRRWIQTFDQTPLAGGSDQVKLRNRGHYLVTGGLGGIGLTIAQHLAETQQARLVLMGRSYFPDREFWDGWLESHPEQDAISDKIRKLQDMEKNGAEVLVRSADVTDEAQMRNVISEAKQRFGPVHGVLHAAGVPGGGVIQLKTREAATAVLAPKIQGTMVLTSLLAKEPLDFFAACSSGASIFGGFGQVDYCAANSFLDLYAAYVRQNNHLPFLSINWDSWSDVGMLADSAAQLTADKTIPGGVVENVPHPLFDSRIIESPDRQIYSSQMSPLTHWVLDEHRIAGNPIIPGTAYLEMARSATEPFSQGRETEIREVFFLAPLGLRENETTEVRTVIEKQGETYSFRILSKPDAQSDEWNEYSRGTIRFVTPSPGKRHDVEAIIRKCSKRRIALTDDSKRDEDLGPRWQSFKHAYVGENELLAYLELPEEFLSDFDSMKIHPALLDRALESGKEYLVTEGIYLPMGYRRLRIKAPLERKIYSYQRLTADGEKGETISCDVTVFNQQGDELLEIEGFSLKRVNDIAGQIKAVASRQYRRGEEARSDQTDGVRNFYAEGMQQGITPQEGVEALRRILRLKSQPQVVVSTKDLQASIREAKNSKHVAEILDQAVKTTPSWARHPRPEIETPYTAPHNENEEKIAEIWQEVLGIDKVGIHDNFFSLSGDSVQAIQIVAKIKELGWQLTAQQLFQHQTVAELATVAGGPEAAQQQQKETASEVPSTPTSASQATDTAPLTPSDFPLAELDEQGLAELAQIIEEADRSLSSSNVALEYSNGHGEALKQETSAQDEVLAEIEGVLRQHPSVFDVLAIGSPEMEEGTRAYVVLKPDTDLLEAPMEFSLFYFADSQSAGTSDKYRLYLEGAKFADRHGFSSVWTPERHFHQKGGLYPNPAVLSSALAVLTERVHLRSGSVVMPLHNPLRVAEEWSVVDNLSRGRIGLSFASGWIANDFAFFPERYANKRAEMFRGIAEVQKLWRGEKILTRDGSGKMVEIGIFPKPIQPELPIWLTCSGAPEMFVKAGEMGFNVLTSLQEQSMDEVATKLKSYREARSSSGHGASSGHVTMMIHAFMGEHKEQVIDKVREPMLNYLRSHIDLVKTSTHTLEIDSSLKQEGVEESLVNFAFERYQRKSSLIGTPDTCLPMIQRLKAIGVKEVACLVDFGVDVDSVLESLRYLSELDQISRRNAASESHPNVEGALLEFLRQKLSPGMMPKSLVLVAKLPEREGLPLAGAIVGGS